MIYPILIYDNLCSSCTMYAKKVDAILKGKIVTIGHYTQEGKELKKSIFPDGYEGLEMSWFITKTKAYGGRAGLKQLIRYIIWRFFNSNTTKCYPKNNLDIKECTTDCKTVKGVFIRSCSILTNSKIIYTTSNDKNTKEKNT